jgi:hypothetical protein
VEVLQAVHLLLAFNLFAVVVAVDPRWLERSLYKTYMPDINLEQGDQSTRRKADEFSPQNYLEKIFQIPFSLDSMRSEGYKNLISDLIVTRREQITVSAVIGDKGDAREEVVKDHDEDSDLAASFATSVEGERDSQEERKPSLIDETAEVPKNETAENLSNLSGNLMTEDKVNQFDDKEKENVVEEKAFLEDWEELFLQQLHPFVNTPRSAKRLLNIYLLLRIRATTLEGGFSVFIDRSNGTYRAALILLAINIGHPEFSGSLLKAIINNDETNWDQFFESLALDYKKVIDNQSDARLEIEFNSLNQVRMQLDEVITSLAELKSDLTIPSDMHDFKLWAPEVGRYAFHWNLNGK